VTGLFPNHRPVYVIGSYRCYHYSVQIIIITGISGSGKSIALAALEDLGFFCVDNLPAQLLPELVGMEQNRGLKKMAVAMDSRSGSHTEEVLLQLGALKRIAAQTRIVFLTANTPTLIARFSETRRRHPLNMPDVAHALNVVPTDRSLTECIELERELLAPLAELGMVLDTSDVTAPVLRSWLKEFVHSAQGHLHDSNVLLTFVSFAFKQGVPLDADLVFDVRCLPNPYYEPFMRKLTGLDSAVAEYLSLSDKVNTMLEDIADFVSKWLPSYMQDGRNYLTVAIGCTGGQHRSVYIASQLAQKFSAEGRTLVRHRALSRR